ncbi:HNH endonuclease [Achromobacter denitrificans]|uniref:HNH endonuclease n=1 Tax=Achromobacter TaxID=222 RepID=UPI003B9FE8CD
MRDYAKIVPTWTDFKGRIWPEVQSQRRLKFKYPSHAALRAHIFHRDGFACVRCEARAIEVPADYSGRDTLFTNTFVSSGNRDMLVLDHVLTLRAGGRNVIANFQALCETCNKRKQREDKAAIAGVTK